MPSRLSLGSIALVMLCAASASAQQPAQPSVPLYQPGAPGQAGKSTNGPVVGTAQREPTKADFDFMEGMIMHHNQAVTMVSLMKGRSQNPQLLEFGQRISISQTDEMKFMRRWLEQRGHPIADDGMAGMDMPGMDAEMPPMPGMLSARQMDALRKAKGTEFDRLFLTGMIQHHTGALTMVKDLFDTPGAGQDPQLFDFTADVDVTQRGEIGAMQGLLEKLKQK